MYASADFAFSFLDAAIRKQNAQVSAAAGTSIATRAPASPKPPALEDKKLSEGSLLLTPPPEAMQTASLLLRNCTMAPEERNLIAAYTPRTPAGSDASLSSHTSAGAAAALTDIPDHKDLELNNGAAALSSQLHFHNLVDLEGRNEFFSTAEDDMDLSMQWLQEFDADKLTPSAVDFAMETVEEAEEPGFAQQTLDINDKLTKGLDI